MKGDIKNPCYEGFEDSKREVPLYQPPLAGSDPDPQGRVYYPYYPTEELQEAVNLAIALKRPILLEGPPGCGKTRLAEAIVYEFTQKYLQGQTDQKDQKKWWFFSEWNVKSVGRAKDGLYTFDTVGRLRDTQYIALGSVELKTLLEDDDEIVDLKARLKSKSKYLDFGALGQALKQTDYERPVVLIDEIDKADSDFSNDLLRELDRLEFTVTEINETYPKNRNIKPIVIITSNRERLLPDAFLRRCLYFKLKFPDDQQLEKIIRGRFPTIDHQLIEQVKAHFLEVWDLFQEEVGAKPPGTSEILDLLTVLVDKPIEEAIADLKNLAEPKKAHLLGLIIKTEEDQERYRSSFGEN